MAKYIKDDSFKKVFKRARKKGQLPPTKILPPALLDEENTKVLNPELLLHSKRFHKYYRMHAKQKRKLPLWSCSRIIDEFFREVKKRMIENEAGVFLERFGYFCFMKSPERKIHKFHMPGAVFYGKYVYALGAPYKPVFFPIRKDGSLKTFTMDRAIYRGIMLSGRYRAQKKNKKYRMIFTILQNLYGRENVKAIIPNRKEIDNN